MYAKFESIYYAVRYVNPKTKSANTEWLKISMDCGFIKDCAYICILICVCLDNKYNIIIY